MYLRSIAAVLTVALILTLAGCAANPSLVSISVQPGTVVMTAAGQTVQLTAIGTYTNGQHPETTRDITNQVQWSSPAPSVVTVNSTGLATAVSSGTIPITATLNGGPGVVTGASDFTVSISSGGSGGAHSLLSISIIPANQNVNSIGETAQYIAIGTFSSAPITQDITSLVNWQSSDVDIATIDSSGLATAVACEGPIPPLPPCVTTITASLTSPPGPSGTAATGSATFTQQSAGGGTILPSLTVYLVGLGSGTVTSVPPGINCTGSGTGCTANFVLNSSVQLTATSPGFGGWSANCVPNSALTCTVTTGDNTTVGAIFNTVP